MIHNAANGHTVMPGKEHSALRTGVDRWKRVECFLPVARFKIGHEFAALLWKLRDEPVKKVPAQLSHRLDVFRILRDRDFERAC